MAQFEHGYALLIGVTENKVPGWSLPSIANDLAGLQQVLADADHCAYLPEHIKVISGAAATRQGILDGLDWLHDQFQADASGSAAGILLYSGHVWRDEAAQPPAYYLIPFDVRQENLRARGLRVEDFAEAVQALPTTRLLVLLDGGKAAAQDDAQGALLPSLALPPGLLLTGGGPQAAPGDGAPGWKALPQSQGRAVLSSSQAEQPAYPRRDGQGSLFIDHLIEALRGSATSPTAAREIFAADVLDDVLRCVPQSAQAVWGKVQQPDYLASGNFPIALRLGGKTAADQPAAGAPGSASQPASAAYHTGGDFTGRDKTIHGDEIHGEKIAGDKFIGDKISGDKIAGDKVAGDSIKVGDISGSGSAIAIGRNARVSMTTGVPAPDVDRAFAPIHQALQNVPPDKQAEAAQKVDALKEEVAKGSKANDSRMAKLLDELVGLVPGMVTAVASTFGTPLLGGIVGPVTAFVVDKIRGSK